MYVHAVFECPHTAMKTFTQTSIENIKNASQLFFHEFLYDSLMDFFVLVTSQTGLNKEIFTQRLGDLHFVPMLVVFC